MIYLTIFLLIYQASFIAKTAHEQDEISRGCLLNINRMQENCIASKKDFSYTRKVFLCVYGR